MIREPDSTLKITKKDLEEQDLYRLNSIIKDLYDRIASTKSGAKFYGTTKFERLSAETLPDIPEPNDVVPWGTISKYLSPQAVRESLVYRTWLGEPIRPMSSSEIPFDYSSLAISIVNTHSNRLINHPASSYDVGSWYYETDRTSLYQVHSVAGANQWVWIGGQMSNSISNQPTDLSVNDVGFLFYSTNTFYTYKWDGSSWDIVPVFTDEVDLVTTGNSPMNATHYGATPGFSSGYSARRARGTFLSPSDVQIGDRLGFLSFRGRRGSSFVTPFSMESYVSALPSSSTIAADTFLYTTDLSGATDARWSLVSDGHIIPFLGGTYDIGSLSFRTRGVFSESIDLNSSFSLSPGASAGYVLTSDGSGVGTWQPSAGSSIPYKISRSSSTLTLTTVYSDLPGCSLNLDRDGDWEIIGVFVGFKTQNDSQVGGRLLNDGTAEPGIATFGLNVLQDGFYTITNTWIVSISGQPKTVKLQGTKIGTGTSWMQLTDSVISAKFLG